ncbi:MAG: DNA repair ATPase [Sandaracinus sp.]|nr:DNA repair ATPase [Sandaracinus sp.]
MTDTPESAAETLEGGNYEVVRARLLAQAKVLGEKLDRLNDKRREVFGGTELEVVAQERVRTENNCIPRDVIGLGEVLLLGYNVFLGLKKETRASDILSVHRCVEREDGTWDLGELPLAEGAPFLVDPAFEKELAALYAYFKDARLLQVRKTETRLLAIFQIGAAATERKVFRWRIEANGSVVFMDARGEADHVFPPRYDFEWVPVGRDRQVQGRYPHLSILDQVFLETTGGDLTIKIENNTESGQGIHSEPVEDKNQSLDDAQVRYAKVGSLILIEVLPFRETTKRYFVYNPRVTRVTRIDAIGASCRTLPDEQGILFPGGFYLATGEHKLFDEDHAGLELKRVVQSPNGEDVLYVFHRADEGLYQLLPYNVIRKELQTPIKVHGYTIRDDGRLIVFRAVDEASRVHPVQIWKTPFTSAEFAAQAPTNGSFLAKVGNAELVRGVADGFTVRRLVESAEPTRANYEALIKAIGRAIDAHYWLGHDEVGLAQPLEDLRRTAELVVDEFEKLSALKKRADEALAGARKAQEELLAEVRAADFHSIDAFMQALSALRRQRGALVTLKEVRYVDEAALSALEAETIEHFDRTSRACVGFLLGEDALAPIRTRLDEILERIGEVQKVADVVPIQTTLDETAMGLDVVSEVVQGLEVDDATARTQILEGIGEVYGHLNRTRATVVARRKELATSEGRAEFGAQFKLLSQAVSAGLALAETPEKCDEQLARLMVQLEELEARFAELDELTAQLVEKREEIYEAFGARKQQLLEARQRRAESLMQAAQRVFEGVTRRVRGFSDVDALNTYFASDPMVTKVRQIAEQLRELGDTVKADEVESKLKSGRQDALRALRDKVDLVEEGDLLRLGKHRFSVNTQALAMTVVPRGEGLALHLTGTDFYEPIEDPELEACREYWTQELVSEDGDVYRGEYLAVSILERAEAHEGGLSMQALHDAERGAGLLELVRQQSASRYDEGYERGVHDVDAAKILERLLALRESGGLLRFGAEVRATACLFYETLDDAARATWCRRGFSLGRLRTSFGSSAEHEAFADELGRAIGAFVERERLPEVDTKLAGRYLAEELAAERPSFVASADALRVRDALRVHLDLDGTSRAFEEDLVTGDLAARLRLARAWVEAFLRRTSDENLATLGHASFEAAALWMTPSLDRRETAALTRGEVTDLLGQHPRIQSRTLPLRLDELIGRVGRFSRERVPGFRRYRAARHALLERERRRLRLDELQPRVLSAFVRNRLVDEVYLPLVGDNLAKQLGAAGSGKRTDLMGLLLLVSPPGYGKTTLMEYVANRLGLVFVKVNGPSLGHSVVSLDPAEAPNATARQEVEKINLAFEMGNNVMLYLDDIQHTNPELLQKFISLCDGSRRIEGVWKGRTRTYDLRGKKLCVVMAGNPYTESGESFQIPDMLANRADTYNLGDVLGGKEDVFALSYLENAITSCKALSPLAARDPKDVHVLVRMAEGEEVPESALSSGYAAAELEEMKTVLRHLFRARDVLLRVNAEYVRSASQADAYRTEPPFKLQGSYRNMNKLAEKIVAAMTEAEVEQLIDDHYASESQTLTTSAEQNLLKLAELRGRMNDDQKERWDRIKREMVRLRTQGGRDDDPVTRLTGTLSGLGRELESIRDSIASATRPNDGLTHVLEKLAQPPDLAGALGPTLDALVQALSRMQSPRVEVRLEGDDPTAAAAKLAAQAEALERRLAPLVDSASRNVDDARALHEHIIQLFDLVRRMDAKLRETYGI